MHAIDLHSHELVAEFGITSPQLFCLREILASEGLSVSMLAGRVHLTASTVVGILDRLEAKGLVVRERDKVDRRLVRIVSTAKARKLASQAPMPLQGRLALALEAIPLAEQSDLARALERIVDLMEVGHVPAAPMLEDRYERSSAPARSRRKKVEKR